MHSCACKDIKKKKRNEERIGEKENNGRKIEVRGRGGDMKWSKEEERKNRKRKTRRRRIKMRRGREKEEGKGRGEERVLVKDKGDEENNEE
jgi:hypothetical protein